MGDDSTTPNAKRRPKKPIITHSSILILSSFIVGIAVQRILPPDQVLLVLGAGVIGMLSYLGLDYVSRHRAERREIEAEVKQAEKLEGRLNKHVPPSIQPARVAAEVKPKAKVDWQTLVAVAEKSKR